MAQVSATPTPPPPPALYCARVLQYAVLNDEVEFSGRTLLFVDGRELGAVPCLAICEERKSGRVLLLHCTSDWTVLGCSAHKSVVDAQVRAERIYRSISSRWVNTNVSPETFAAYLDELFDGQQCRMCGKRPDEVESMTQDGSTWVCDTCSG
jgi:hypothetical protein